MAFLMFLMRSQCELDEAAILYITELNYIGISKTYIQTTVECLLSENISYSIGVRNESFLETYSIRVDEGGASGNMSQGEVVQELWPGSSSLPWSRPQEALWCLLSVSLLLWWCTP